MRRSPVLFFFFPGERLPHVFKTCYFSFSILARYNLFGSCSATARRKYPDVAHIYICVLCATELAASTGDPMNK